MRCLCLCDAAAPQYMCAAPCACHQCLCNLQMHASNAFVDLGNSIGKPRLHSDTPSLFQVKLFGQGSRLQTGAGSSGGMSAMQFEQQSSGAENVCDEQKLPSDILNAKLPACSKECFVEMLSQVQFDQGCRHLHTMVLHDCCLLYTSPSPRD